MASTMERVWHEAPTRGSRADGDWDLRFFREAVPSSTPLRSRARRGESKDVGHVEEAVLVGADPAGGS